LGKRRPGERNRLFNDARQFEWTDLKLDSAVDDALSVDKSIDRLQRGDKGAIHRAQRGLQSLVARFPALEKLERRARRTQGVAELMRENAGQRCFWFHDPMAKKIIGAR